jgi:ABC-type transport system involved in multi-copper enzyme maturation permease subunit
MELTMLWYKAWRESRTRFGIIALALIGFSLFVILFHRTIQSDLSHPLRGFRSDTYSEHVYKLMYSGTAKGMFAILVIFLGLGGLLREQTRRTAMFTLALPATRVQLVVTQIVVGLMELAALSLLPALLIPALSVFVNQHYSFMQALHFSILWFACGAMIFATAFLLSVLLRGEYLPAVACYVVLFLNLVISSWPSLLPHRLNLMWTMGEFGTMRWNPEHTHLLAGPLPEARLFTILLIALGMFVFAVYITEKQDF